MDGFWKTCRKKTETPEGEVKMGKVFKEFEELCVARGRETWRAEGKDEQTELIVTNMLRCGYSSAEISICTGVGTDKVASIARNAGISI